MDESKSFLTFNNDGKNDAIDIEYRKKRQELGPSKQILQFVEKYKDEFKEGDKVLELGVGEGRNLEAFQELDLELFGIELDPKAIQICNNLLHEKEIRAEIIKGSFTDTQLFEKYFSDESLKAVMTQYAIQNSPTMDDVKTIFFQVKRILKKGGLFFIREQANPFIKDADRTRRVAYFSQEEIHKLVNDYGFEIVEGNQPIKSGNDPRRLDNQKIIWNLVLRKR